MFIRIEKYSNRYYLFVRFGGKQNILITTRIWFHHYTSWWILQPKKDIFQKLNHSRWLEWKFKVFSRKNYWKSLHIRQKDRNWKILCRILSNKQRKSKPSCNKSHRLQRIGSASKENDRVCIYFIMKPLKQYHANLLSSIVSSIQKLYTNQNPSVHHHRTLSWSRFVRISERIQTFWREIISFNYSASHSWSQISTLSWNRS